MIGVRGGATRSRFPTTDTISGPKESRTLGSEPSAGSPCRYSLLRGERRRRLDGETYDKGTLGRRTGRHQRVLTSQAGLTMRKNFTSWSLTWAEVVLRTVSHIIEFEAPNETGEAAA
jgi:hypothetical protein